jgi:ubiquinone/menaquinone biosynthesis C-methylase UbiE
MDDGPDRRSVKATYDRIGDHFAETRAHPWPEVEAFVADAPEGGLSADIGCGNGRHAAVLAEYADRVLALDASRSLLARADRRGTDRLQGDASRLPITTDTVDVAVYVATLHHLPSRAARRESLAELARVLAPGGQALVSAWSTAHDRFDADTDAQEGFDTDIEWTLPDGTVVDRFYHIYAPAEFGRDLAATPLTVENCRVSSGNCYARVRP